MQNYPFNNNNSVTNEKSKYDVVFLVDFAYSTSHTYNMTSNLSWFQGACPPDIVPQGSINYFHFDDVVNEAPFYPIPNSNFEFPGLYYYPAPYVLLVPSLGNANGTAYAGYDDNGNISNSVQLGKPHTYEIDQSIDLTQINPSEKIIYNPSKVEIDCDLTFPVNYKFLTVYGKYPDKAWVTENNPGYDDLRDVLCPSDQIDEDGGFLTEYIVNNILTIEPGVTIMDAQINGSGTVRYYPDDISGNFRLSTDLKLEFLSDQIIIDDPFVTWENEIDFQGSLISIEPGATLEIKNTLEVGNNTKIIVKRGGKLIVDGGTITTQNGMWPGIEVWGTASSAQNTVDQGWIKIINGGLVENADVGVRTIKVVVDETKTYFDYDYTGGIVQAVGAMFKNNRIAIYFYDYGQNSQSGFTDCDFITDIFYPDAPGPDYFVRMNGVHGIGFTYCRFMNSSNVECNGSGIYSFNSGYTVKGKCASGQQPCTEWVNGEFANLKRGIYATSGGAIYFPGIDHISFTGNHRAIYFSAMDNGTATNCEITTGPSIDGSSYGIYLDRSTAYTIEENTFSQGNGDGIGLIVNNSGGDPNRIYRNSFTGLYFGIVAQNKNGGGTKSGLVLKCNNYHETTYDKLILTESVSKGYGIATNQGSSGSDPKDMAGNLFQIDSEIADGNFDDILNEGNSIVYYYPENTNNNDVEPIDITDNVTLEEIGEFQWTYEDGCPPPDNTGGGGIEIGDIEGKMANTGQKIDSTENLLSLLIDGGNTETVQADVDNSMPPETMQVYNELMAKSPYLSDTVISTAIEKEEVLPGAMIRDIMVANPKAAKSDKLMDKLDERWDPLPDYMKGQILAGRSIVSIREETESRLAAFKLEKAKYFNALARYYLNDTIDPQASLDSLAILLQNENSLPAKYQLAILKGERGAWNEGLEVLNNIPVQFDLALAETESHTRFTAYYALLSDMAQQGKSIVEVDSAQIATLFDIEEAQNGPASVYARNILLALNEMEYDEPILMPDMMKSTTAMEEYNYLLGKAKDAPGYIKVKPTPAKDYVIIEYGLEREVASNIEIYDISGNLKYSDSFTNRQDRITIDTRNWKPGVYIVTLKSNGMLVESLKFTIID
ncbi:MAG: T9SS type A sorting domain-containing protein [Chlorobi bacterium]|nr:T9SS type A sorting domain-containing protein [Chlorobiota bacterium]